MRLLRIGTRASPLALWQARSLQSALKAALVDVQTEIVTIRTEGDRTLDTPLPLIGGKGVFTSELEEALLRSRIDCAVHSLKDLPTETRDGLVLAATLPRGDARDALISRFRNPLADLPEGACIGTSSVRRAAQILSRRPDLKIHDIRGNVDTRIARALDPGGGYDGIVLARAGLERLGRTEVISETLEVETVVPAPGQGAIAVQTRDEAERVEAVTVVSHFPTFAAAAAERAFLEGLGGGCSAPVGAFGHIEEGMLILRGRVCAPDGTRQVDVALQSQVPDIQAAREAGETLAEEARRKGALELFGR